MINGNDKYTLQWICSTPYGEKQTVEKNNIFHNYNAKWLIFKKVIVLYYEIAFFLQMSHMCRWRLYVNGGWIKIFLIS